MFAVIFDVHPKAEQWDAYLATAKVLRPELEGVDGFVDNIRYRSLTRDGWILSLSSWRDEKSVVRWRTRVQHHDAQALGRDEIFAGYHLRVGEILTDTQLPAGHSLTQQRLDETEIGAGTTVTLIDATQSPDVVTSTGAGGVADRLGLPRDAAGLVAWDVFDAVLNPGAVILLLTWRNAAAAEAFERSLPPRDAVRVRSVRIVRDYGMFDRREAPQFYPDAHGAETVR